MSTPIPTRVAQFLRKMPRPAFLLADDKKIPVPNGGRVWPDIWRTLSVIKPSKLQALDAEGQIIRALDLESVPEVDADGDDKSPDMTDLQFLAKLLDGAYEKGGKQYSQIIDAAMRFVEQQSARLLAADKEIERLRLDNIKLRREIAEILAVPAESAAEGGVLGAVVQGFLQAQNGAPGSAAPVVNGHPQQKVKRS